ncbi:MAG: hypothetical protein ACJA0Q_000642 [Saprospiraceae bacterium]|jgi:hypothetical protein
MFIAQEKHKNSIAEYVLYMWQIENLIRVSQFNIDVIDKTVIDKMGLDDNQRGMEVDWYSGLIQKMKKQQVQSKGHLLELRDLMVELSYLHNSLLNNVKDSNYGFIYNTAKPFILELKKKQDGSVHDEVEVCLNGLFAFWMLKASKKPVSADTSKAMGAVSKLIGVLSAKYREMMKAVEEVKE